MTDFVARIKETLIRRWDTAWWFNVPTLVFFLNFVAIGLTGGGHVPYLLYIPILLLEGPLLLVYNAYLWI